MAEKEKNADIDFKDKKKLLEKELKEYETSIKELKEQKKKEQQREEEDYKYNLELKRKKESDAYNAQKDSRRERTGRKRKNNCREGNAADRASEKGGYIPCRA